MPALNTIISNAPGSDLAGRTNNKGQIDYSGLQPGQYFDLKGNIVGGSQQTPWQTKAPQQPPQPAGVQPTFPELTPAPINTAPAAPIAVITADKARNDLAIKQANFDRIQNGLTQQTQTNSQYRSNQSQANQQLAPEQQYQSDLRDINAERQSAFDQYKRDIDSLQRGTFPLSSSDLAQIESVQATFRQLEEEQRRANANYEAGLTQLGIRSGRSRYAAEMEMGNIKAAVDSGLAKVRDIEVKALDTVNALKSAFQERDYERINKKYDQLNKFIEEKSSTLTEINNSVREEAQRMMEQQKNDMEALKLEAELQKSQIEQIAPALIGEDDATLQEFADSYGIDALALKAATSTLNQQKEKESLAGLSQTRRDFLNAKASGEFDGTWTEYQKQIEDIQNPNADLERKLKEAQISNIYSEINKRNADAANPAAPEYKQYQYTAANYATRLAQSNSIIKDLEDEVVKLGASKQWVQGKLPNWLKQDEVQQIEQAQRNFINAVLRRESGASISPTEFDSAAKQYFPQPGDSKTTLRQKAQNRSLVEENFKAEAGPAYRPTSELISGGGNNDTTQAMIDQASPEQLLELRNAGLLQ